jgi:fumarylpyruvate hydrolase
VLRDRAHARRGHGDAVIALEVNGQTKQNSNVDKLIWNIREIIEDLSLYYHLQPGDIIYTGTPEGVGAVLPGDKITGRVAGVAELSLSIGAAA